MAITLTNLTSPTSPVTPRTTSQGIFDDDYAKLTQLPLKQKLIIALLGLMRVSSNAASYVSKHPVMVQDAKVFLAGLSTPIDLWASLAAIGWTAGKNAVGGITLATTVSDLQGQGNDLLEQSEEELIREIIFVMLA